MNALSQEELLKEYKEAQQKVDNARNSIIYESIKEKSGGTISPYYLQK